MEADHDVAVKGINARGLTEAIDVGRRSAGDLLKHCNAERAHVAVLKIADAQDAIDSFADQIDQPIALAYIEFDAGIFGEEVWQPRHYKMPRQRAVNIHAQQSLRLGAAECGFGLLEIGDQRQAAPVIGLAVQRRADLTRGPLQEPHAEARLKLRYRVRDRRARDGES